MAYRRRHRGGWARGRVLPHPLGSRHNRRITITRDRASCSDPVLTGVGMPNFTIVSDLKPTGDQPAAIEKLVEVLVDGKRLQTLLGVTGSGKTFTMANVIEQVNRTTIVLAHNKTLAAQLYAEFKEFFPNNAVEYFVSYYDYYQPEAYVPRTDTFIEKDADINEEID